ncbi:MAG: AAA family ATPase [Ruminococcaceae bacterium]|nr:AAA family ATPase [Oscillospiraceae bacterium]
MSVSRDIYLRAKAEIDKRHDEVQIKAFERREECKRRFPEIAQSYKIMADTACECVKAIALGGNAQDFVAEIAKKNLQAQQVIADTLKKAGLSEDYLKEQYFCTLCNDSGFVEGKMCTCLKNVMKQLTYNSLCDKVPLEKYRFDKFSLEYYPDEVNEDGVSPRRRMKNFFEYCVNYADDFNPKSDNLLMTGETGLGKTHLSLAIAGQAAKKGFSVVYGSAQNLLSNLESEKFGRSTAGAEQAMQECDLLIIDDLGAEFSTQFTISAVYNIINTRLMMSKPTIISTNMTMYEIEEKYSQRIASRILGNYILMEFVGKDIRVQKRNSKG